MNIRDKIEKLFRLAEKAGTPEEAETAMARAQALITQYEIDPDSIDPNHEAPTNYGHVTERYIYRARRVPTWRSLLAMAIAQVNSAHSYYARGVGIKILGHIPNLAAIEYLFGVFARQIENMTKARTAGLGRAYANSYKLGAVSRLSERLKEANTKAIEASYARASDAQDSTALVRIDRAVVDRKAREQAVTEHASQLRLRSTKFSYSGSGYGAGRRDANLIPLTAKKTLQA